MIFGRVRRFFGERPMIEVIAGVLFGLALFVFLVVTDTTLIVRAYERSDSSTLPAVVIGAAAAAASVLAAVWYRRRADHIGRRARRALGWAGIAWSVVFVIAFVWTHAVDRVDELATPLQVATVSYVLVILVAAVGFLPFAALRLARPATHGSDDRVRVMHIRNKQPYFVAYCDCGWAGTAYDASEPDARDKAFRDAREHGSNVASEVEHPLD